MSLRLRHLSDSELEEVQVRIRPGIDLDECPTCSSGRDEDGQYAGGTYKLRGELHDCNCAEQVMLRKHYLLANIPDQYMRLDWFRDFDGSQDAKDAVRMYLDAWEGMKLYGLGMEFGGKGLGVGKTFAATTIGKELVKRKEKVFFLPFNQMLDAFTNKDQVTVDKLKHANVLILDELQIPFSERAFAPISHALESIIRDRTNYNAVTIITTNLTEAELEEHYPRTYSLLSAKQTRVEMTGRDARQEKIGNLNLELAMNGERMPIT